MVFLLQGYKIYCRSRRLSSSLYCCSFISHRWRAENTTINITMSNAATNKTRIRVGASSLLAISALLYQPEKKLRKMVITSTTANGSPTASCLMTFFLRSRLSSQYLIKSWSFSDSIIHAKLNHKGFFRLQSPFKIYILQINTLRFETSSPAGTVPLFS